MDEANMQIVLMSLRYAKDIIGLASRPIEATGYESFNDTEIRDMYYAINKMCIRLDEKIKEQKRECSNCVYYDTDVDDQPCCTCVDKMNWKKDTADCG